MRITRKTSIPKALKNIADKRPFKMALYHREETISYIGFFRLVQNISSNILSSPMTGTNVAVCLPKAINTTAILFGILEANLTVVPINHDDPFLRILTILKNTRSSVLFCNKKILEFLISYKTDFIKTVVCLENNRDSYKNPPFKIYSWQEFFFNQTLNQANQKNRNKKFISTKNCRDSHAYILHTSGSTGIPKGIVLSHQNILNFVFWISQEIKLSYNDRVISLSPFTFDIFFFDLFASIKQGSSIYLIDDKELMSASKILSLLSQHSITTIYTTPTIYSLLIEYGFPEKYNLSSLKNVLCAGEVLSGKLAESLKNIFPKASIYNLYGPTETNVCTFYKLDHREKYSSKEVPIGKVCAGYVAKLNPTSEFLEKEIKNEKVSLLNVKGPGLMKGYLANNTTDKKGFSLENNKKDILGYYNTGDLVKEEKGLLYFCGRLDSKKKRHGNLIDLDGISTIIEKFISIEKSVTIFMDKNNKIISFIKKAKHTQIDIDLLLNHCRKFLPKYSIPSLVVEIDKFPLLPNGKIDLISLEEHFSLKTERMN